MRCARASSGFSETLTLAAAHPPLLFAGKLRERLAPNKDLAKAARTLTELQQLRQMVDLSGIAVVEAEEQFITRAAAEIRAEARAHACCRAQAPGTRAGPSLLCHITDALAQEPGSVALLTPHTLLPAQASTALQAGLDTLSQAEVGAMLQVFHNLNELPGAVDRVVAQQAKKAVHVRRSPLFLSPSSRQARAGTLLPVPRT
jgi:hypothetical protein